MDLLLLEHGGAVAVLTFALVIASGVAIAALVRAARTARAARGFGARMRGARRGLRGARPGERVFSLGTLEVAAAPVIGFDGTPVAIAWAESDGRVARLQADGLALRDRLSRAALAGPIDLAPTPESVVHEDFFAPARARMHELGASTEGGPVTTRAIVDRELVAVLGIALPIAAREGTSYRSAARALAIGPDEDGTIHAVGLGRPKVTLARVGTLGVVVGLAASFALFIVAPVLSAAAPALPWAIADAPDRLPYRHWVLLASPPTRERAVSRSASWIAAHLAGAPSPHVLDLAHASQRVEPRCDVEARLMHWDPMGVDAIDERCPESAVIAASVALQDPPPYRVHARRLVGRWIRARGAVPGALSGTAIEEPLDDRARALGPSSRADESAGWVVVALTVGMRDLPPSVVELRTAWMHDLALIEGARGDLDLAHRLVLLARRLDPDHPDHERIERALVLRTATSRGAGSGGALEGWSGEPGTPGFVLARYREWATQSPDVLVPAPLVASPLRAAAAADELGLATEASSLAHAVWAWPVTSTDSARNEALRLLRQSPAPRAVLPHSTPRHGTAHVP